MLTFGLPAAFGSVTACMKTQRTLHDSEECMRAAVSELLNFDMPDSWMDGTHSLTSP